MTVIRWNPLREIDDLFARAGAFPAAAGNRVARTESNGTHTSPPAGFLPPADVSETQSNYFIDLELPGVAADDVQVTVHEGVVSIAGERRNPFVLAESNEATEAPNSVGASEGDAGNGASSIVPASGEQLAGESSSEAPRLHRLERRFGAFERRFRLPKDADSEAIEASARDGVLRVSIGRRQEAARRAIEVRVA